MTPRKAILITPNYTLLSGSDITRTPALLDLPDLGRRLGKLFRDEGVALVDDDIADQLAMDGTWATVGTAPRVYVGRLSALDCPLAQPHWHQDTVASFDLFHELLGVAWHRSGGVAGLSLLQQLHPKGKSKPIVWESPQPAGAEELAYFPADFSRAPEHRFVHGYDRRRSGLAAMNTLNVARYALKHTGRRAFDPHLAGWWQIEVPPWNDPRMPNPAGYCAQHQHADPNEVCLRWVTTPTVELLNTLAEQGVSEGVRHIHDSWTGDRSRLFVNWAASLERAITAAEKLMAGRDGDGIPSGRAMDAERVRDALSAVYRETPGMFTGADSWVARHDWYAAKVAMERRTAWMQAWHVGQSRDRWPVRVDGDKWWYSAETDDGAAACPPFPVRDGLPPIGNRLGQWRLDGTREVR